MSRAVARGGTTRPRVRALVADAAHVEQGDIDRLRDAGRVAIIAHFSASTTVTKSVCELVEQLQRHDYVVAVVSAARVDQPLQWGECAPDVVVRKPNVGYDFGSWSVGLDLVDELVRAPRVILANDSMVGPFTDLGPALADFDTALADVWGLTDTRQYMHHLQSYFVGYRDGVLADRPLADFWADVRHEGDKWDVIRRNELGLTRVLRQEGYLIEAMFTADRYGPAGENPVIKAWRRLLGDGFPFVKKELLRDTTVAADAHLVPTALQAMYGIRIQDWM